ncbi:Imm10 family immunity protein [uncultured Deinococcus sp.]|uniref:Imm10 family immunity protein n=1 Tax=uncultured Deinococcus sp. TaxID=158789 RepID=UPI0025F578B6|nr:Imm10 family immunity protein [uncultured Deinococcus sp.]
MPPVVFDVQAIFVGEIEDADTFMVALGDHADEPQEWLELQRALVEDEQDVALGMDTYCLVRSGGPTVYGGVAACVLSRDGLILRLDDDAAQMLGAPFYELMLRLDDAAHAALRDGLRQVFADRWPAEWQLD